MKEENLMRRKKKLLKWEFFSYVGKELKEATVLC